MANVFNKKTMLEPIQKTITKWYLVLEGERIKHSTKELAIAHGKPLLACGYDVKLIEVYDLYMKSPSDKHMKRIDHQEFDRTILLK